MADGQRVRAFFSAIADQDVVLTSARVALVVGTLLGLINYGDRIILRRDMQVLDWVKLAVTYCVPFCVATYGAARYAVRTKSGPRP